MIRAKIGFLKNENFKKYQAQSLYTWYVAQPIEPPPRLLNHRPMCQNWAHPSIEPLIFPKIYKVKNLKSAWHLVCFIL